MSDQGAELDDDARLVEILTTPEPARPRRRPAGIAALVAGIVALLAGGLFAISTISGGGGGADDPEAAVRALLRAVNDEDVIGVLEALAPGERDALKDPVTDLAGELRRLEILSGDFDLGDVDGVDFEIDVAGMRTEDVVDGLAVVHLQGGTSRARFDPARLPLGDFVRGLAGDELAAAEPTAEEEPIQGDAFIATIRDGDRWYVSLWYSVAEAARREAGAELPALGRGVPATGAESPEQAVRDLVRAAGGLDLRRMIELTPPDEMAALHDYAPLFLDRAEAELAGLRDGYELEFTALEVSADRDGDRALVTVDEVAFTARFPLGGLFGMPGVDGEGTVAVSYADGCVTIEGGDEPVRQCGGDEGGAFSPVPIPGLEELAELDIERPALGFVAVERDGRWFLSPTRTLLGNLVAVLRVLDRDVLDAVVSTVMAVGAGVSESSAELRMEGAPIGGIDADIDIDARFDVDVEAPAFPEMPDFPEPPEYRVPEGPRYSDHEERPAG